MHVVTFVMTFHHCRYVPTRGGDDDSLRTTLGTFSFLHRLRRNSRRGSVRSRVDCLVIAQRGGSPARPGVHHIRSVRILAWLCNRDILAFFCVYLRKRFASLFLYSFGSISFDILRYIVFVFLGLCKAWHSLIVGCAKYITLYVK